MGGTLPTAHRVAAVALMVLHMAVHTAAFTLPGSVALLGSQQRIGLVARGPLGVFSKPRAAFGVPDRRFTPLALAPSGVDGLALETQAAVVFAIMGSLAATAAVVSGPFLDLLEEKLPKFFYQLLAGSWIFIGCGFILLGSTHFSAQDAFVGIFPPQGTWGLWYHPCKSINQLRLAQRKLLLKCEVG